MTDAITIKQVGSKLAVTAWASCLLLSAPSYPSDISELIKPGICDDQVSMCKYLPYKQIHTEELIDYQRIGIVKDFLSLLTDGMKDLDPKIIEALEENFWNLV